MSRAFDPETLFESRPSIPFPTLYPERVAELDAVKARTKGIAAAAFPRAFVRKADRRLIELIEQALARGAACRTDPCSVDLERAISRRTPMELKGVAT